jgi:hypothetical protein
MDSEIKREKRSRNEENETPDQPEIQKVSLKEFHSKSNGAEEVCFY